MKKLAILIALGLSVSLAACSSTPSQASPEVGSATESVEPSAAIEQASEAAPEATTEAESIEPEQTAAQEAGEVVIYPEGVYKVGADIPAGIYFAMADEDSILSSLTVRDGSSSDATVLDTSPFTATAIIQVQDGEYLKVTSAEFTDISNTHDIYGPSVERGFYSSGSFLVGFHIPAGEYKVEPEEDAILSSYTIYSDGMRTVKDVSIVSGSGYVTLQDGEFLKVNSATLTPTA